MIIYQNEGNCRIKDNCDRGRGEGGDDGLGDSALGAKAGDLKKLLRRI